MSDGPTPMRPAVGNIHDDVRGLLRRVQQLETAVVQLAEWMQAREGKLQEEGMVVQFLKEVGLWPKKQKRPSRRRR